MNTVQTLIDEYSSEVHIAASSFFAWKSINNLAAVDSRILAALQTNALSWNIIAHSLQITFFTALGRIFDRDSRSLTVRSFIAKCQANLAEFNKSAFEARRLSGAHGIRPPYLDEYVKGVYVPVSADFVALDMAARKYATRYRNNYEPIRHKVVAHKDVATIGARDALYANTNIGEGCATSFL